MTILDKIREIISSQKLDMADKLIEIEKLLPKAHEAKQVQMGQIFGEPCGIRQEGNAIIFDGNIGGEYTDNPTLQNMEDLYYTGEGTHWGEDLNGKRYWKLYHPSFLKYGDKYNRLSHLGVHDIVNEKARVRKMVFECLEEIGLTNLK